MTDPEHLQLLKLVYDQSDKRTRRFIEGILGSGFDCQHLGREPVGGICRCPENCSCWALGCREKAPLWECPTCHGMQDNCPDCADHTEVFDRR